MGPYSAGSTSALKMIGFSCCLGHEGSGLIHQLECLASSSEKLSAHPPVPRPEAGLKGRDTVYPLSCSPWLRDDQVASIHIFLVLNVFSMTGTVLRASIFCWNLWHHLFVLLHWLLLSSSVEDFKICNRYFSLFHLTKISPLLQNRAVLYLLMGLFKEDKCHIFTHFQNEWIDTDSAGF